MLVLHSQQYMAQGHTPHIGNDHHNTRQPPIDPSRASGLEVYMTTIHEIIGSKTGEIEWSWHLNGWLDLMVNIHI